MSKNQNALNTEWFRKWEQLGSAGLCIKPKTQVSKVEALKEIIRAWD